MSLKPRMTRPHSKPSRTSDTSSFSRRSEARSALSTTTLPSRIRRTFALRRMTPLVTMQPAMLPIFDERKISRISAWPRVTSSNSGLSMPLRAASISSIAW